MKNRKKHWIGAAICVLLVGCLLSSGCAHRILPRSRSVASAVGSEEKTSLAVRDCDTLDIHVDEATVLVALTDENEVSASCNTRFCKVRMKEENGTIRVDCHATRDALRADLITITLNVPATVFNTVKMDVDNGSIGWRELPSARIDGTIDEGMGIMVIPSDFAGSLDLRGEDAFVDIASQNDFKNCDVTGETDDGLMSGPNTFTCEADTCRYTNGTRGNVIRAQVKDSYLRFDDNDTWANAILDAAASNVKDMRSFIQLSDMPTTAQAVKQSARRSVHGIVHSLNELDEIEDVYPETILDAAADKYSDAIANVASAYAESLEDAASEYARSMEEWAENFADALFQAPKASAINSANN